MPNSWWKRMLCKIGIHSWWYEAEPFISTKHMPPSVKRCCERCGQCYRWNYANWKNKWERIPYSG